MASKALTVIQVGDVWLNVYPNEWHGYENNSRGRTQELAFSREHVFAFSPRLTTPRTIQMTGFVVANGGYSIAEHLSKINSVIGVETDIIAREFVDCCDDLDCCGSCGNPKGNDVIYLQTRGFLKTCRFEDQDGTHVANMTFETTSLWRPLNRYIWEWTTGKYPIFYKHPETSDVWRYLRPYPFWKDIADNSCKQWLFVKRVFQQDNWGLNPNIWHRIHSNHRPNYVMTGQGWNWSEAMPYYQSINTGVSHFNAEPSSVYVFRRLPTSGTITITVRRLYGNAIWEATEDITTIDTAIVSAKMVAEGYGVLRPSDYIYIGDISRKPLQVYRPNVGFLPIAINISYTSELPGSLGLGANHLFIEADLNVSVDGLTPQFAHIHTFRRI